MKKEIVLIHGWSPRIYNSNLDCKQVTEDIAWENRKKLIDLLSQKYKIIYFNLPGFCCVPEPDKSYFDLEDFTEFFANWLKEKNLKPDAIIGYSFGGALALDYKYRFKSHKPVILIAPALKRKETVKSSLAKYGKNILPENITKKLKSTYQNVFSKYYREGSPFLRAGYDKIVRRDMRPLLRKINPKEILLIFGDSDKSTPVEFISEMAKDNHLNCTVIPGGDHNIGGTHPQEIVSRINQFLS